MKLSVRRYLLQTENKTVAAAKVAWPHRGTSHFGVNHCREKRFPVNKLLLLL